MIRLREGAMTAICADLGVSREQLAARIGVSPSTLYRIEAESRTPSARLLALLILVSGRGFEDLFTLVESDLETALKGKS